MLYTYPHYYKKFQCIASDCEDTCCAGWAITIDPKSLKKYRHADGAMKMRLKDSVDWKQKCFKQREHRCAFLNDENLCDLYTGMGPDSLCWTCRTYPRHIEVFDGVREVSLCLSCIEAARIILGTKEPVRFLSSENDKEESCEDEDFDFFLYTKLSEARDVIFEILENRGLSSELRMALCLALAHDLQRRVRDEKLYEVDGLLKRYQVGNMCRTAQDVTGAADADQTGTVDAAAGVADAGQTGTVDAVAGAADADQTGTVDAAAGATGAGQPGHAGATVARFCSRLASAGLDQYSRYEIASELYTVFEKMEPLDPAWPERRDKMDEILYGAGKEVYEANRRAFLATNGTRMELLREQIMVYFVFGYFCGAVYNDNPYGKMKLAVAATILVEEMLMAEWMKENFSGAQRNRGRIVAAVPAGIRAKAAANALPETQIVDLVHCFSREVEHSDENRGLLEDELVKQEQFCLKAMLAAAVEWKNR